MGRINTVEFPLSSEFSDGFPEVFQKFPEVFRKFPEVFPVKNEKRKGHGGDRTHVLRITDLALWYRNRGCSIIRLGTKDSIIQLILMKNDQLHFPF